jgi:hypothetical protein
MRIKSAILGIPLGLVGMVLLLEGFLYWSSATLKEKIQEWAKEETTAEVFIEKARISLLSNFPHVSLVTKNIVLLTQGDTLLALENTNWQLQIRELLSRHLAFKAIHLEKGSLYLTKNKNGSWNTDIFSQNTEEGSIDTRLSIQKARLSQVRILYKDMPSNSEVDLWVHEAWAKGSFQPDQLEFSTENRWTIQSYKKNGNTVAANQTLNFSGNIFREGETTHLEQLNLYLDKGSLIGEGEWIQKKDQQQYSINLQGDNVPIQSILEALDWKEETTLTGTLFLGLKASGTIDTNGNSTFQSEFVLNGGEISSGFLTSSLKDIEAEGTFTFNGKTTSLQLVSFGALYEKERLHGHLQWMDFRQPEIKGQINGKVPLSLLSQWGGNSFQNAKGSIIAKEFVFSYSKRKNSFQMEGQLEGERIEFIWEKKPWKINVLTAEFQKKGGTLLIPELTSDQTMASAHLQFQLPQKNSPLTIGGEAKISHLNSLEWMHWWENIGSEEEQKTSSTLDIQLNLQLDLHKIKYQSALLEDAKLNLQWNQNVLAWKGKAEALQGDWSLNQKLHFWPSGGRTLRGSLEAKQVDVKKLFESFNDFDQEFIGHNNLDGKIHALGKMDITWSAEGELIADKLQVLIGSKISNGHLIHWPLMDNFASFVKVEDLRKIRFAELINIIEIKNGVIFLPTMFVQSNALNLEISGEHTLEHEIYYNIKVNAGQVLTQKFERHDPQLQPVKAENTGWFNLYYTLSGSVDNFQYKKNRKAVKTHFESMSLRYTAGLLELEKEFGPLPWLQAPRQWTDIELFDIKTTGKKVEFIDDF